MVVSGRVKVPAADERRGTSTTTSGLSLVGRSRHGSAFDEIDGESVNARIERLGRERPGKFRSVWEEVGFVYAVTMSQAVTEYCVSGFAVVLPSIIDELDIPETQAVWPANAFSLVVACFLLPFGRIADRYGGYPVYVAGVSWLTLWTVIAGFSQNKMMMFFCRALQGLGPAAYLPASLMLLGSVYRPGPRKNLIFALYGAAAPLGFYIGIFFAGVAAQYATWGVYFWIGAGLNLSTAIVAYFTVPSDVAERKAIGVKMDWWGSVLIPIGLILVVYALTDSAHAPNGWRAPYIYSLFAVGVLVLCAAAYVEGWLAEEPLLPSDLFRTKHMKPLMLGLFFSYGTLGIFLLYSTLYMTNVMGASPMQLVAWYTPVALGGLIISMVGGLVLHKISGTLLIIIAHVCVVLYPLVFALMPLGADYWHYTFWAMIACTVAIDITFTTTNIFITTSLPLARQGLAGGIINSLLHLGFAVCLGVADVAAAATRHRGLVASYKTAFWVEVGLAGFALLIFVGFVRVGRAKSDLTADERCALEAEARGEGDATEAPGPISSLEAPPNLQAPPRVYASS